VNLLVLDTATGATVAGAVAGSGAPAERRHDPAPGERPGHAQQLLALAGAALAEAGIAWQAVDRIGVGVGPGSFTGLRIGVATARSLAQATGAELAPVSSLGALALGAGEPGRVVLAVLDARRGEAFVAAWRDDEQLTMPRAVAPEDLAAAVAQAGAAPLAVGDGAVKFRARLEAAGAVVPEDDAALHRLGAAGLARLAAAAPAVDRDALVPEYVRPPDARPRSEQ
jgi:tRNA threonylcarbamoyladenosine biosynthesis protein TsaB